MVAQSFLGVLSIVRARGTACLFLLAALTCEGSAQLRTRVLLERSTFSARDYGDLQHLADQVTLVVDDLIPGRMSEFVRGDIICFQTTRSALAGIPNELVPPITLSTNTKLPYEPALTSAGTTRIALLEVEPQYAPAYRERFVYQLSHELAHVKMGVRIDNFLIETFAVAISHEVLLRLAMKPYADLEFDEEMHDLPFEVQRAYAEEDLAYLRAYWQQKATAQSGITDRSFQTLGAALIRLSPTPVPWPKLLGIALISSHCPLDSPSRNCQLCPPDIREMEPVHPFLIRLGY